MARKEAEEMRTWENTPKDFWNHGLNPITGQPMDKKLYYKSKTHHISIHHIAKTDFLPKKRPK